MRNSAHTASPLARTSPAIICLTYAVICGGSVAAYGADSTTHEDKIERLLNCTWMIARAERKELAYKKYLDSAVNLAVDNGRSLDWLN